MEIFSEAKYSSLNESWAQVKHLFPSPCLDIITRAKQIFFFFENRIAFVSSLGLDGKWLYFSSKTEAGQQHYQKYLSEKNHRRFSLNFGTVSSQFLIGTKEIIYNDAPCYGNFTITSWQGAIEKMSTFGPDLLQTVAPITEIHPVIQSILPHFYFQKTTLEMFRAGLREPRRAHMEICRFLLNQKYFSGIGNYLKAEILYRARINPFRTVSTLTDQEIINLYSACLTIISTAHQCGGLTHGTFFDPDMEKGLYRTVVYNREGETDPNGFIIRYVLKEQSPDDRGTYYVPEVQL